MRNPSFNGFLPPFYSVYALKFVYITLISHMSLMTNNPAKFTGLKGHGLAIVGRVPVMTPITEENKRYLETKMSHIYESDIQGPLKSQDKNDIKGWAKVE